MKITIRCARCDKALSVEEDNLGKKVRCPACGEVFAAAAGAAGGSRPEAVSPGAPSPSRRRAGADDEADEAPRRRATKNDEDDDRPARRKRDRGREYHDEDEDGRRPRRRPAASSSSGGLIVGLVVGGVLLVLLLCGGGFVWFVVKVRSAAERMQEDMAQANNFNPPPPNWQFVPPAIEQGPVDAQPPFGPGPVAPPFDPWAGQPPVFVPPAVPPQEAAVPPQHMELALKIDPFNAVAISSDSKAALVATPGGKLVHYSCPDFAVRGTYELPNDAYEMVLDRKGNLYAMCVAVKKDAMFPRDRRGVGDLYVFPMADVLAGKRGDAKLKPSATLALRGLAATMILSPDGEWVYVLDTHNQKIVRVSTARQKIDGELDKLEPSTQSMCLTPNGKLLYALAVNGALQQFDTAGWKREKVFQVRGGHSDIQATDDGRVFLNSSEGQWTNVRLFDVTKDQPPRPWAGIYQSNFIKLSPDQRRLYVSCWNLSPSNITSYYVPPERSEAQGKQCASVSLDANFGARGNVIVSPDGGFLFCDAGKIILLGK